MNNITLYQLYLNSKTGIIEEGGAYGHMSHLYENWSLTFGELKEIFNKAGSGELYGTEKTDGKNIYLSYSVLEGKAKAVRNKTNIKEGGLDGVGLAKKFDGRGVIKDAFIDAFDAFEKTVKTFPRETQVAIFGPDANIWYNAEIMDPLSPNVINYDVRTLLIHQAGHAAFDKQTGKVTEADVSQNAEALYKAIITMQAARQGSKYKIVRNAVRKLKEISDKTVLNQCINDIENIQQKYNLNNHNTLQDYITARINEHLIDEIDLPPDIHDMMVKKLAGETGLHINTIVKSLPKPFTQPLKDIAKNKVKWQKEAIRPIEMIVHNFAVEMLKGMESAFVLNNDKEVQKIRSTVTSAINKIAKSSDDKAMEILKTQLEKLKSPANIDTAIEGFVFDFNGRTYKVTGNFACVNQIIHLLDPNN